MMIKAEVGQGRLQASDFGGLWSRDRGLGMGGGVESWDERLGFRD